MTEQAKTELSRLDYGRDNTWYPLRKWWQPGQLFNQDIGLPPFLEPGDHRWVDWIQGRLAGCSWPGYLSPVLLVPYGSGSMPRPGPKSDKEQYKWRVSLDVVHFSPSEISLSIRDGFLQVGGKHEERPDEHGFITRCFTRKYRLPAGIDVTKITSTLSGDGILCVEAPLPDSAIPADTVIPIQVEKETTADQPGEEEDEETPETDPDSADPQPSAPRAPEDAEEFPDTGLPAEGTGLPAEGPGHEEDPPPGVDGVEARPSAAAAELQRRQEEEARDEPAGKSHPPVPADGEGTDSVPEPFKHHEALDSPHSPDTAKSNQEEDTATALDREIQPAEGSGEATEELAQPEEPEVGKSAPNEGLSQELEVPDVEQDHTK